MRMKYENMEIDDLIFMIQKAINFLFKWLRGFRIAEIKEKAQQGKHIEAKAVVEGLDQLKEMTQDSTKLIDSYSKWIGKNKTIKNNPKLNALGKQHIDNMYQKQDEKIKIIDKAIDKIVEKPRMRQKELTALVNETYAAIGEKNNEVVAEFAKFRNHIRKDVNLSQDMDKFLKESMVGKKVEQKQQKDVMIQQSMQKNKNNKNMERER